MTTQNEKAARGMANHFSAKVTKDIERTCSIIYKRYESAKEAEARLRFENPRRRFTVEERIPEGFIIKHLGFKPRAAHTDTPIERAQRRVDDAEADVQMYHTQYTSEYGRTKLGYTGTLTLANNVQDLLTALQWQLKMEKEQCVARRQDRERLDKIAGELADEKKSDSEPSMQKITKIETTGKHYYMNATLACGHVVRYRFQHEEVGFYLFCQPCFDADRQAKAEASCEHRHLHPDDPADKCATCGANIGAEARTADADKANACATCGDSAGHVGMMPGECPADESDDAMVVMDGHDKDLFINKHFGLSDENDQRRCRRCMVQVRNEWDNLFGHMNRMHETQI